MNNVYIVTANDKVSQEGYKSLKEAQKFILGQLNPNSSTIVSRLGWKYENNGIIYNIAVVSIK